MKNILTNKKIHLSALILLAILLSLFVVNARAVKEKEAVSIEGDTQEFIEAEVVPDIVSTIIFENVSDLEFVPKKEGKTLRINLVKMEASLFENGEYVEVMPVIAKGKLGSIWETPGGRYPVEELVENYFSQDASLWFPYSIHLFGNYFIHGIPKQANGREIKTTSGAIRFSDEDAKKIFEWVDSDTSVSIYSDSRKQPEKIEGASTYFTSSGKQKPLVSAESYLVADVDTGEILLAKNPDLVVPIASVSKLMTALVSFETHDQFAKTKISKEALSTYGTSAFRAGEEIVTKDLLYPLLLVSSNDAAEILAEKDGREKFMRKMNEKAKKLGMKNTFFEDASGLSPNNVSSATDLFTLSKYIEKEKPFLFAITTKKSYSIKNHSWGNISQFLNDGRYKGGKGGQTSEAKRTSVGMFELSIGEFNTKKIAVIILRSNDKLADTKKLLAYVESSFIGNKKNIEITHNEKTATLGLVGDIMIDRGVEYSVNKNFAGDFTRLFENTKRLAETDFLFGNLEGPATNAGRDLGNLYSFRMPENTATMLKDAGFDIVSFANNHVGDYGKEAFVDTLTQFKNRELPHTGAGLTKALAEDPAILVSDNGLRLGFLGFSDVGPNWLEAGTNTPGILLASDPRYDEIIKNAKEKVDALVVSIHFGDEYVEHNARQENLARRAIDAGALIVAGHHPHVPQDVEVYKGGLIIYSLGNFIFDQYFSKETMEGLAVIASLEGNSILKYDIYRAPINKMYQPEEIVIKK